MQEVLRKEIVLTPESEKTNVPLNFFVAEGTEKLKITYSYSPKELGDGERAKALIEQNLLKDTHGDRALYPEYEEYLPLKNLVTLSLDSPEGYRGAAHRQSSSQCHIISEDFASVGFLPGKPEEGQWTLTLNVHALVTQECLCRVTVETGGADDE